MEETAERISCLMVTRPIPARFALFQRSIACFLAQTYPNRELVVVLDEGKPEDVQRVKDHLAPFGGIVRVVQPATKCNLGTLRNHSAAAATGSVFCGWDDDDISYPTRVAEQYAILQRENAVAVLLQDVLHFFPQSRQLYWTNYYLVPQGGLTASVMFRRSTGVRWPAEGRFAIHGEDVFLWSSLELTGKVTRLAGMPYLYVYVFHGDNACDEEHHRKVARELAVSKGRLLRRQAQVENLSCYLGEQPIDVMGNNGLAFTIPGRQS